MIIAVFRYGNETAFFNRLNALNVKVRKGPTGNGDEFSQQQRFSYCTTDIVTDINGDNYMSAMLLPSDADKFPPDNNPAFALIWASNDLVDDGEGNMVQKPWPEVEVQAYDIDGNPSGTRFQGVGRIA